MTAKTLFAVPVAVLILAGPLAAQEAEIDTDGDGMVSFAELQAILPEMTEDQFMVLDVTGDGLLDADEIAAGTEAGLLPASDG